MGSVTAIADRSRLPYQPRRSSAAAAPAVTVTFEIQLAGERLPRGAARLLEMVRDLAGELGEGAVRVASPERTAPVIGINGARVPQQRPEPAYGAPGDGVLYVDPASRMALRDGEELRLTRLEFDLLLFLCEHPDRAFRRAELLRGVWGYDQTGARTVDVHIRRLRAKVGVHRPLVTTVHGVGYRLDERARVSIVRGA
ncbi:MAG TPA: winged helix-turn-helix domain-containing protein [Pilimelia sp.]|nr:winged helix-turn-helix domain-containing protein [Pilimelia sp.]